MFWGLECWGLRVEAGFRLFLGAREVVEMLRSSSCRKQGLSGAVFGGRVSLFGLLDVVL